ncbi:MAG: hypothetical protein U1F43_01570 [Myxococcota bacterium]
MTTIPEQLEDGVYQWVFGDGEDDPGVLVSDGRKVPEFLTWLGELEGQIGALKRTLGKSVAESDALARLRALKSEVERAQPILFQSAVEDLAPVISMTAFKKRTRRLMLVAGGLLALAAAVLLIVKPWGGSDTGRDVSSELAALLTHDIVENTGFGFGGAVEPSAHDRGFLLGAVIDLSRPRRDGKAPGKDEIELARKLATVAQSGLDAPDDAEARRVRALGGCAAILGDDPERSDCERGIISYATARDNVIH